MNISKYKYQIVFTLAVAVCYFLSRLINLTENPIFTDEAIYLRWSQIGSFDAAWRFIPLVDGKPPLYHWIVMATLRFIEDPLFAGRLVSVLIGFVNLALIWTSAYILFRRQSIANISTLLYLTSPMMFVYDRIALVDGLLTSTSLVSFIFAVLVIKYLRLDTAMLLGVSIGAGLLTKASGLIFLLLAPTTLLIAKWQKKDIKANLIKWVSLLFAATIISQMVYAILRLSQFFYRISQKNTEFIITLEEFFDQPFHLLFANLKSLFPWQISYLTIPIAILVLIAFISQKNIKEKILLGIYWLAPLLLIATFNKSIFPRFLLFSTPYLLMLAAVGIYELSNRVKNKTLSVAIIIFALLTPAIVTLLLITNQKSAPIPTADKNQYITGWTVGYGTNDIVDYLLDKSLENDIYIGTQGTFGLLPYALEIYVQGNPNIQIESFWPVKEIPQQVLDAAGKKETYFLYNEINEIPPQDNIELIMEFPKNIDQKWYFRLFRVLPK